MRESSVVHPQNTRARQGGAIAVAPSRHGIVHGSGRQAPRKSCAIAPLRSRL
jgi:hypothetical protein